MTRVKIQFRGQLSIDRRSDEPLSPQIVRGRRGAGMIAVSRPTPPGFNVTQVMRDAQFPSRTSTIHDPDGNAIIVLW